MSLPAGTVTFLFTDVVGSTRLWDSFPDDMRTALALHDEILTTATKTSGGTVVKHTGDGLFIAFGSALAAVRAAVEAQQQLADGDWPEITGPLQVRMALHTADVEPTGEDYLSPEVNRVARIESAGHGGQILASNSTARLIGDALPEGATLVDLGTHRLRGISAPEHIHQIAVEGLHASFPPLRTERGIKGHLPSFTTPFVGRAGELDELVAIASEPTTRLLSIVGNGGMGKTRLAVETARRLTDSSAAVGHFLSLESLTDDGTMTTAVAGSIGFGVDLHISGTFSERTQLFDFLRAHELVLVLDNLEHLPGAGSWISDLLAEVPSVTVIATSRERLQITAERVYPLGGLDADSDAIALFSDRCRSAGASVDGSTPGVRRLVDLLGGMPLALELAAAWAAMLPVEEIAVEIRRDLDFLTSTQQDTPDRHRSVRAVFEQTWRRLDPQIGAGLASLAIFVAPFSREDAASVAGVGLPVLAQLVNASLLRRNAIDETYGLHPLLREFALEKLGEGRAAAEERYARRYLSELLNRADDLVGADQIAVRDVFVAELDHLRAGLAWAVTHLEDDELVPILFATYRLFMLHSWADWVVDSGHLIDVLIDHNGAEGTWQRPSHLLLRGLRLIERTQFEHPDAIIGDLERLIELAEPIGGDVLLVACLARGMLEVERSAYVEALEWLDRAESISVDRDPMLDLQLGAFKGWALYLLERLDEARSVLSEYLARATEIRNGIARAFLLSKLGVVADEMGDHATAADHHHEGREVFVKAGDAGGQGYTLSRLSWTHYLLGNHQLALRYALDGLEHFESMNLRWGMAISHSRAGLAEVELGRTTEAKARFLRTIEIAEETDIPDAIHYGIIGIGLALSADGRDAEAARLLLGSIAADRNPYRRFAETGLAAIRERDSVSDLDSVGASAATLSLGELSAEARRFATGAMPTR